MTSPVNRRGAPVVAPTQPRGVGGPQGTPLPNIAQQPLVEGRVIGFAPQPAVTDMERRRMERLLPTVADAAQRHGVDAQHLAAVVMQESRGVNYLNHSPEQGGFGIPEDRGLVGLNERGLLRDFERFAGQNYGRHSSGNQVRIPERAQIEFLARTLANRSTLRGNLGEALREWHAGARDRNTQDARNYEASVLQHMRNLFPSRTFPTVGPAAPVPRQPIDRFNPS